MKTIAVLAALAAVTVSALPTPSGPRNRLARSRQAHSSFSEDTLPHRLTEARSNFNHSPQVFIRSTFNEDPTISKDFDLAHADSAECASHKSEVCGDGNSKARTMEDMNSHISERIELVPESELHDHIEIARQALEHIQQNIGNLEAMNVHATTLSDDEFINQARLTMSKSDNGKAAHWNEDIENVLKKAETARKMQQDSMKSTDLMNSESIMAKSIDDKIDDEVLAKKNLEENIPSHDMSARADEIAMKSEDVVTGNKLVEKPLTLESLKQGRRSEFDTSMHAPATAVMEISDMSEKSADFVLVKSHHDEKATQPKMSETMDSDSAASEPVMKKEFRPMQIKKQDAHRSADTWAIKAEGPSVQQKSSLLDTQVKEMIAKASENNPVMNEKMHSTMMKSEKAADIGNMKKASENEELMSEHDINQMKSVNLPVLHSEDLALKSANNQEEISALREVSPNMQHLEGPNSQAQENMPMHMDDIPLTARDFHDYPHSHLPHSHVHHLPHFSHHHPNNFGHNIHAPLHSFHHGYHGIHGKSADGAMEQGSVIVDVERAVHEMQKEGAARGAYGGYGAGAVAGALSLGGVGSGAGAVGVFPGANVGGCAVPLLLSCSPSVVPGSLAKAPAYGAHAYRASHPSEGDFSDLSHTKRHANEIRSAKVKRTPTKTIQKISLHKKL